MISILAGVGLGILAVVIHLAFTLWVRRMSGRRFYLLFFGGFILRIAVVAAVLTTVLVYTSLNDAVFTFSFILSYLFWSVIEMVWFNTNILRRGV